MDDGILSNERGFRYALPALCLAAFHMVVAYAILGVGPGFQGPGDNFIPGLFEGLIGITLYIGLAICVLKAIIHVRCLYVLDFIGIVGAARLLLPLIGMIGGGFVIAFVIIVIILMVLSFIAFNLVGGLIEALAPVVGSLLSVFVGLFALLEYVLPALGFLLIAGMVISALTGLIAGVGNSIWDIFRGVLPLL